MNPARFVLIGLIRSYQWFLAPGLTFVTGMVSSCRFEPSCSNYAVEALRRHGARKGCHLTLRRVCRCHPWGGAGIDLVPDTTPN